jgi:hypothetical protein
MNARVLDALGRELSACHEARALKLVAQGQAELLSREPLTIRLRREVAIPAPDAPEPAPLPLAGQRVLLHVCCAPCATYTARRLQEQGAAVTAFWFNPNIHPFSEHERRRVSLARYATEVGLPMVWEPGYDMISFLRQTAGYEPHGERCALCYKQRLARTAQRAAELSMDAICTTLLISPYQDQALIRSLGEAAAARHGLTFYFENLRRGFAEHHRLAHAHNLYLQDYCGCIYSEWEAASARRSRSALHDADPDGAPLADQ